MHIETILARVSGTEPRVLPRLAETRESAVAVVLRPRAGDTDVLLIKRAESPSDPWSGHMAFPGGRRDPGDRDLVATARRETLEETGLDLATHARLVTYLDEVEAMARGKPTSLVVRPHLFVLERDARLTPNYEVAEIVWVSLARLLSGEASTTMPYAREGRTMTIPAWDVDGRVVWGLTYVMLEAFFARLR